MPIEFVDDSTDVPVGAADDELRTRAAHGPAWLVAVVLAALAALAVFVLVRNSSTDPHPVAVPSITSITSVTPRPLGAVEQTLIAIYQRGRDVEPAQDVVRGGSGSATCTLVAVGSSPQRAASMALQQRLPRYRIIDTARIIDQSAGLCALQVRARDSSGNTALIMVTSPLRGSPPARAPGLEAHAGAVPSAYVEYAQFTTRDGWTVVVGVSGPKGRQPSPTVLGELASSPALRW